MKKWLLAIFVFAIVLIGGYVLVNMYWPTDNGVSDDLAPLPETVVTTTTNHKSYANSQSHRRTSVPTECYEDDSPSVCSGNYDVVTTTENTTCTCSVTHNDKTYTKKYEIKSKYEYNLDFGETDGVIAALRENDLCTPVCDEFTRQIVNGTYVPRGNFTLTHSCDDAFETQIDEETKYISRCNCMASDASHEPTKIKLSRVQETEFAADTAESALAQCNRWCARLCDAAFSIELKNNPKFEIPVNPEPQDKKDDSKIL